MNILLEHRDGTYKATYAANDFFEPPDGWMVGTTMYFLRDRNAVDADGRQRPAYREGVYGVVLP